MSSTLFCVLGRDGDTGHASQEWGMGLHGSVSDVFQGVSFLEGGCPGPPNPPLPMPMPWVDISSKKISHTNAVWLRDAVAVTCL